MSKDFWVFGYGSLMWRPGFDHVERVRARLPGWRRRFALKSIHYRGTPEAPGLVLGLDAEKAAACEGVAYRASAEKADEVHTYLRDRELVSYAYRESHAPCHLADGRVVEALIYVLDPEHPQYAGDLTQDQQATIIASAAGSMGCNRDYLESTLTHLREMNAPDPELDALAALVRARCA